MIHKKNLKILVFNMYMYKITNLFLSKKSIIYIIVLDFALPCRTMHYFSCIKRNCQPMLYLEYNSSLAICCYIWLSSLVQVTMHGCLSSTSRWAAFLKLCEVVIEETKDPFIEWTFDSVLWLLISLIKCDKWWDL